MVALPQIRVMITPTRIEDADALEALQRATYGDDYGEEFPDTLRSWHFRSHVEIFPEGQFVARDAYSGAIVGSTSSMRFDFDLDNPHLPPWAETTGMGYLTTHNPRGQWLYGVESCVLPDYQGHGVGARLMDARFDYARRHNLRGLVAGSNIMGYSKVAHRMTAEDYMREVVAGRMWDNNLSKQLKHGFRALHVIPGYISDFLSCGYGVAMVWENPNYRG
jgi:GNAT superfamily N-acetyltransferase